MKGECQECQARGTSIAPGGQVLTGVALGFRLFYGCSGFSSMWLTQDWSHDAARRTRLGLRRGKVRVIWYVCVSPFSLGTDVFSGSAVCAYEILIYSSTSTPLLKQCFSIALKR